MERHAIRSVDVGFEDALSCTANAVGMQARMAWVVSELVNAIGYRSCLLRRLSVEAPLEGRRDDELGQPLVVGCVARE